VKEGTVALEQARSVAKARAQELQALSVELQALSVELQTVVF
jgi:hypothetical protein